MAKKKENQLTYLQVPLPTGAKYSKMTKRSWSGYNKKLTMDTGALSMERNISTKEAPYLTPSPKWVPDGKGEYKNPICIYAFDNFELVVYRDEEDVDGETLSTIKIAYITNGGIYYGILKENATSDDEFPRSIVQFNVYDTYAGATITDGEYVKKLLIFPDKKTINFYIERPDTDPSTWNETQILEAKFGTLYYWATTKKFYERGEKETENDAGETVFVPYMHENGGNGFFEVKSMDVVVKKYYNNQETVLEDGTKLYPPPDTASHDYYYLNTYNNEPYKWCEYDTKVYDEDTGEWVSDGGTDFGWRVEAPPSFPDIKYATVHMSRLFGVDDERIYASGFNNYANWNLDTATEYNEANAWMSVAQSNTKADGVFTGIITFQNHVVCFKRDFMHEIYNTKNPFRVQDIYAEGAIDHRTLQDVDGNLIFVSEDNVKVYTGGNPEIISYYLNIDKYTHAVSGTDGRNYYLYCEDSKGIKRLFVFDTFFSQWSEQGIDQEVKCFAHNKNGMYALCADGIVYKIDTNDYSHTWAFETDLITNETVDIKHIRKMQMFADIGENAWIKVYMLYDDEEFNADSHLVYDSKGATGRRAIRVKPRKTANYGVKLHIEGEGFVRLYELELHIEAGGELYV